MNEPVSQAATGFTADQAVLGKSYLLIGGDAYLSDRVLDLIRTQMSRKYTADVFIIYGDEVKAAELNEHLDAFSIFSSAKLLIIRNAEKLDKELLGILADYFQAPSEIQSLAILTDKTDQRFSSWKAIQAGCQVLRCDPPRLGGEMRAWLDTTLQEHGKTMTYKAKDLFINRIELDYAFAANELAKLVILLGNRATITEDDVLKSLGTTRVGTLIDFFRALGKKMPGTALEAMDKMLVADWEPLQVFFQVQKFYTIIWRILYLRKIHLSEAEITGKRLNDLYLSQRKEFYDFSKKYDLKNIPKIMNLLLDTDAQLKLSSAEPHILLTNCLLHALGD